MTATRSILHRMLQLENTFFSLQQPKGRDKALKSRNMKLREVKLLANSHRAS